MPGVMRMGMVRKIHGGAAAPFTPIDPTSIAGLQTWLKADAIGGLADGDPVTTWEDSHTSNNDATQSTAAAKPTYQTGEQNGLAVVRFDGTDDVMTVSGITNNDAARTIFVVAKQAANTANKILWSLATTDAMVYNNGAGAWRYADTPQVNFGGTTTNWSVVCVRYNSAASADAFIDTGTATNFDPNDAFQSGTGQTLKLGSTSGIWFWNGDMAEILVYDSALSEGDRGDVRDYLRDKWGL
jgi:hypothetical protein